jgi:hypothetical protein
MRKLGIALCGMAVIGLALPTLPAQAEESVVIKEKEHRDRGLHLGERYRDHDRPHVRFWERPAHRDHDRVVIIKRGHRDHD